MLSATSYANVVLSHVDIKGWQKHCLTIWLQIIRIAQLMFFPSQNNPDEVRSIFLFVYSGAYQARCFTTAVRDIPPRAIDESTLLSSPSSLTPASSVVVQASSRPSLCPSSSTFRQLWSSTLLGNLDSRPWSAGTAICRGRDRRWQRMRRALLYVRACWQGTSLKKNDPGRPRWPSWRECHAATPHSSFSPKLNVSNGFL